MNKILLFTHLRDAVGEDSIKLDVSGKSIAELKEMIVKEYPSLNLDQVMIAVNEEFAMDEEIINEGDTIALIPPVSGG